jgi:hypothetical protein
LIFVQVTILVDWFHLTFHNFDPGFHLATGKVSNKILLTVPGCARNFLKGGQKTKKHLGGH